MPYIDPQRRTDLFQSLRTKKTSGDLSYLLALVISTFLKDNGPLTYQSLSDVLGALEGTKLEFVRNVLVPYEKKKQQTNGDVWPQF